MTNHKAFSPIVVTLDGIVSVKFEVSLLYPASLNAPSSIVLTPYPMLTDVRDVQALKARCPMLVTLFGISILVKFGQSLKAQPPILVTLSGIVIVVKAQYLKT